MDSEPTRRRLGRRAGVIGVAAAVLALVAVGVLATLGLGGAAEPTVRRTGPAATAPITRQTVVDAVTLPGELGYGATSPVTSTATGTVTWLPEVGATVARGGVLLRADDQPVVLLYGPLPMYRTLAAGVRGADVRQFEQNLSTLGYHDLTVDDTFSASTAAAVKRWQRGLGLPETGIVDRSQVVYAPDAIRIAERLVRIGAGAAADVLSYTGSTRVVTVSTDPGKASWAAAGVAVTLTARGSGATAGTVSDVSPVEASSTSDSAASVRITIAFAAQDALGGGARSPVSVRYVRQEHKDVLTVPVNALLALAEGGYGLEVVTGNGSRIVAVQVGLFADGRVEISGTGLRDGDLVGVPA